VLSKTLAGCRTTKMRMALSAFTMAEILLSLTIIGVVAAITLPSLTGNINERTWNTQRKALYARFSQAIALMPAVNGYGTLVGTIGESFNQEITTDTAAETFVTAGLSKVLKINNICDYEHLGDCGIPSKITTLDARTIDNFTTSMNTLVGFNSMFNGSAPSQVYSRQLNTRAAAFETANGESVVVYYNPNCRSDIMTIDADWTQPYMCANFVYDLNGTKGPNTMGKDIGFITVMYPSDPVVVAPVPEPVASVGSAKHIEATRYCTNKNNESRLPSRDELMAMFYNKSLLTKKESYFWSTSLGEKPDTAYHVRFSSGSRHLGSRESSYSIWCIKR
ncbi:MAG: hypothetical protein NC390_07360, partial [Fusobacterium sp.]|nr:hypothetical protein [Fusobacterium sp.]